MYTVKQLFLVYIYSALWVLEIETNDSVNVTVSEWLLRVAGDCLNFETLWFDYPFSVVSCYNGWLQVVLLLWFNASCYITMV